MTVEAILHYLWLIKLQLEHKDFVSAISNFPTPVELVITQVDDHVKMRLISQLINGISRVLQKLLSILMVQLFQNLSYYYQQEYFLLFLF